MKLDQKQKLSAQLGPATPAEQAAVERSLETILRLANLSSLSLAKPPFDSTKGVVRSTKDFELFIPYEAAFDVQAELSRLRKEAGSDTKDIAVEAGAT